MVNYDRRLVFWLFASAIVLVTISLTLPMWSETFNIAESSLNNSSTGTANFYWYGLEGEGRFNNEWQSVSMPYEGNVPSLLDIEFVMNIVFVITLLSIVILAATMFYIHRCSKNGSRPKLQFLLVASMITIISPVFFMLEWPSAYYKDAMASSAFGYWGNASTFFGSFSSNVGTSQWGPGLGWYLQIAGFVLILVSFFYVMASRREVAGAGQIGTKMQDNQPEQQFAPSSTIESDHSTSQPKQAPIILCGKCRKTIPGDARLCPYCGTEVLR